LSLVEVRDIAAEPVPAMEPVYAMEPILNIDSILATA
jgi:hypothetical protein